MEIYEFEGPQAEEDLLRHHVTAEGQRLRAGGHLLICGPDAHLQDRLTIALASAAGGAFVSHLPITRHAHLQHALTNGTPVILRTDAQPARLLTSAYNRGLVNPGRPTGDPAVQTLLTGATRYTHIARDHHLHCVRATTGPLTDRAPHRPEAPENDGTP